MCRATRNNVEGNSEQVKNAVYETLPAAKLVKMQTAWLLQTAGASVVHAHPAIQPHLGASVSPTQCGFKRSGALKPAAGSSFRHDVSGRESESRGESERWAALRNRVFYNTTETSTA
ncbi:hypothetical protein Q5P01_008890 [Channa striata]|uniref:Uncharacterized protein n=1 Tax=Channa striata TaxID=64152 RepID=A0AA88N4D0_CHASR|nr:hypothetical protein Q5P01_008890 [Channa striata]